MATDTSIIQQAKDFVTSKFKAQGDDKLAYHNIEHTRQVAAAAEEIANNSDVTPREKEILLIAAWFHDLGYTVQSENHEEIGREMVEEFLQERNYPVEDIRKVGECIMATRMPQEPSDELERIMCDADMMHLADVAYLEILSKLRNELEGRYKWDIADDEWLRKNRQFLASHQFFTEYAREHYAEGVKRSIEMVKSELESKLQDRNN